MQQHFDELQKSSANFIPLSPLSFVKRSAQVYADRPAVISGSKSFTWSKVYCRSRQLASALVTDGIGVGDTVAVLSPNNWAVFECHFGIPMAGAVINTINTRLETDTIGWILEHGNAVMLIYHASLRDVVNEAIEKSGLKLRLLEISDNGEDAINNSQDYEAFLASGDPDFDWRLPEDEWQAISLNYTSGTSGKPKGVVYHHRGSYLMALGTSAAWHLPPHPVYLYTVPMFHCNGWGHAWTMALAGATVVCPSEVSASAIFSAIDRYKITHFGGAPVVLSMLINAPDEEKKAFDHKVQVMTAGAPPPAAVLEQTRQLGFEVMQVYGLTETFGHVTQCLWQDSWDEFSFEQQAERQSWQGVALPITEEVIIANQDTDQAVPQDGTTSGEIRIRGNTIMKGYYRNPEATEDAFKSGWFESGDLAVWHERGYIQIRDRIKDVIISGGENVSSVEVENVLHRHPSVAMAAVVAMPDEKWGEVPCAYVALKTGEDLSSQELIDFCRQHLAGFKTPKKVVFGALPQTATGKIQKFVLREQAKRQNENE